ncbi:MAG: hypothetical protein QXE52_08315 [Candidatus Caldarchaeum sp.]
MAQEDMIRKILETFVSRADSINTALIELRGAIQSLADAQSKSLDKLDQIRLELRELATRIEMALARR